MTKVTAADLRVKRISHVENVWTVWLVTWLSTAHNRGKAYYVTTYPMSNLIYIETVNKRSPVSERVGSRIGPLIREAINRSTRL